jgi:hypothetical protein
MRSISVRTSTGIRTFPSIAAASQAFHRDPAKVRARILDYGWSVEEALGIVKRKKPPPSRRIPLEFSHNGKTYSYESIDQAATANGLCNGLVCARIRQYGWTIPEALGLEPRKRISRGGSPVAFEYGQKRYQYSSISEAAQAHEIPQATVSRRLAKGWTIQQSLGLAPIPAHTRRWYACIYVVTHRPSGMQYVGQTMVPIETRWREHIEASCSAAPDGPSLQSAIRRDGPDAFLIEEVAKTKTFFHTNTVEREWIKKLGTKVPRGFNLTSGGSGLATGVPVRIAGEKFPSLAQAARRYGVAPFIATQRVRLLGWSPEQAVGAKPPPSNASASKAIVLTINERRVRFGSIGQAAKACGIPLGRVYQRIRRPDWTLEQVFGLAPRFKKYVGKSREVRFSHKGQEYCFSSLKLAAQAFGVSYGTAQSRVRALGWSVPQALGLLPPPSVGKGKRGREGRRRPRGK